MVKEFIYQIYLNSNGTRFGLTNVGRKGEQKFDIAILWGGLENPSIVGLVEAKYVRNWHRAWPSNASDETTTSFKSLATQLGSFKSHTHGGYPVKLSSRSKDIYGLVIASYISDKKDGKQKEHFFNSQLTNPITKSKFRYHDYQKPYFKKVYDDVKLNVLNGTRYASLRIGLWKLIHQ